MKSILLTTTALVAFAGAAVAEVSFSGSAALGYNDTLLLNADDEQVGNNGFYWEGDLVVNLTQELDNGVTAGVQFDFDFADTSLGDPLVSGGYILSLTTENAGLFFGDVAFAAQRHWVATGWMASDKFSEADGETAIRGDVAFGGFDASVSYVIADSDGDLSGEDGDDLDQLSIGARGDVGNFNVSLAYQAEATLTGDYDPRGAGNGDFYNEETFGVSVGTTFAGASVRLAYADDTNGDSLGVSASYPVGPLTLSGAYVSESRGDDSWRARAVYSDGPVSLTANYEVRTTRSGADIGVGVWRYNVEGSYDLGNGLVARAGYLDRENWDGDAFYVAGEYDLGAGATLLVSYAEANHPGFALDDEVGAPEYQVGTTVEVSFKF